MGNFEPMKSALFLKFVYIFLCAIAFLSFGTYTILGNVKSKASISINDTSEDNQESTNETSKELTESFLAENHISLNLDIIVFNSEKLPLSSILFYSFGSEPSTPPPDLA
ncbi:hypothetical protein [Pedobacter cryotolerans]|uniref:Uncharacterized protein n=1 Tax=Pedobacter cryotolerans TaxID=2571270 RepID=A0A4U1C7R3_9SPHI|nr:hypothetical protein [Pedobacter cryotolerans]TKC01709.1 hypothetical protein FA045_05505 [Pedobacter cryotolerans]